MGIALASQIIVMTKEWIFLFSCLQSFHLSLCTPSSSTFHLDDASSPHVLLSFSVFLLWLALGALAYLSLQIQPSFECPWTWLAWNTSQPKLSALGAGVRSVEKVDSRGPSSWGVCLPVCKCTHPGPFRAFPKGAISTLSSPLWYCFPNEPEQWSTGWPISLVKTSCWLSLESSSGWWAATVATYCPGRLK